MKSRQAILIVFLFIVGAALLAAEDFIVTYTEGATELKSGAAWKPIKLGAKLPEAGTVRLGADGLLECRRGGAVITIARGGTYALKDLAKPARSLGTGNALASVDAKIRRVAGDDKSRIEKYAAMGVRGVQPADDGGPQFVDTEPVDPLAGGAELISAEKYPEAIDFILKELEKPAEPAAKEILRYYLAYAYSRNRQNALALKHADKLVIGADSPLYPDYVLLKGRLLYGSFAYDRALMLFTEYLTRQPQGDAAQASLLLSAYCREGMGEKARQKELLQKAVSIDPATDEGREAAELLKSL